MIRKRYLIISLILITLTLILFSTKTYAANLDQIEDYQVKVDPRMNDGTLDITYTITWRVLDSTTEGPLTWVSIGTPNENFDSPIALSVENIKSIQKYNGANVRIDFKKAYHSGEKLTFKYKIHQRSMCKTSFGRCKYVFTPAWFTDARVDNLTILWNADSVKKSDSKSKEDNYLIWNKTNLSNGGKFTINVTYDKKAFSNIDTSKSKKSYSSIGSGIFYVALFIIIAITAIFGGGDGYYGHRGFYGGGYGGFYGGGCAHSSCACAHSSCASSCACACAGSGRAGCSRKDFYGTNITSKKIEKAFKRLT